MGLMNCQITDYCLLVHFSGGSCYVFFNKQGFALKNTMTANQKMVSLKKFLGVNMLTFFVSHGTKN